jgi:Tfp pilus assembly protein PilV
MPLYSRKSITLIELLIAIVLLAMVILGVNNVNVFSRYHLISTDRRTKIQNDASRCLEHMTKNASQAIGNEAVFGGTTAIYATTNVFSFFADANGDGLRGTAGEDYWAGYRLNTSTHQLGYCSHCSDYSCSSCSFEYLANNITAFSAANQGNYVNANITTCWNPASPATCNTPDNPSITMDTSIHLPSVSTN